MIIKELWPARCLNLPVKPLDWAVTVTLQRAWEGSMLPSAGQCGVPQPLHSLLNNKYF